MLSNPTTKITPFQYYLDMSKLIYKQVIDPESFDRETVLMGTKETPQN